MGAFSILHWVILGLPIIIVVVVAVMIARRRK